MALRQLPDLERLEIAVLVELYKAADTDDSFIYSSTLKNLISPEMSDNIWNPLLEACNRNKYFERRGNSFLILPDGIRKIYAYQNNHDEDVEFYVSRPLEFLAGVDAPPAFDATDYVDLWEPIPLSADNPIVADALAASEIALSTIEENNGYADSEPEDRNSVIASIRGTIESIRAGLPSRASVYSGLLAPLKYISKKFADSAMGVAAKTAVEAVIKLIVELLF